MRASDPFSRRQIVRALAVGIALALLLAWFSRGAAEAPTLANAAGIAAGLAVALSILANLCRRSSVG